MKRLTQNWVDRYSRNDDVLQWLDENKNYISEGMICDDWLCESLPKRCIFNELYGDLITTKSRLRVLDVAGGITRLTSYLAKKHEYVLSEVLAHDSNEAARYVEKIAGHDFIVRGDWSDLPSLKFDIIIANDIFPNVDQRLDSFLTVWLPRCSKMRISLTWYESERFYHVKRIDADEQMCMLSFNSDRLIDCLQKWTSRIVDLDFGVLKGPTHDLYPNGRQVCIIELVGSLSQSVS